MSHGEAGADVVAPSGMIDGMVGAIRAALDEDGLEGVGDPLVRGEVRVGVLRAVPRGGRGRSRVRDRREHQMDPANAREALREASLDVEQGADGLMVKPALGYLDVVRRVHERLPGAPARRLQRERRVRDGEGGGGERLARRAARRCSRSLTGDPARRRRSRDHVPREGRRVRGCRGRGEGPGRRPSGRGGARASRTSPSTGARRRATTTSLDRRLFMQLHAFGGVARHRRARRRARGGARRGRAVRGR